MKEIKRNQDGTFMKKPDNVWSFNFDSCISCKTTVQEHQAKGLCSNCYSFKKRHENPNIGYQNKWAYKYDQCIKCGTMERKHLSKGLCTKCYDYTSMCISCNVPTTKNHNKCRSCSNTGSKRLEKTRRKMSSIKKQQYKQGLLINAFKAGKDNPMYGKHPSPETSEKKRQSMKRLISEGKLTSLFKEGHTPWLKNKTAEEDPRILNQENHWHWKGGISPTYVKIRNSIETKQWREKVFKRDHWICRECEQVGGKLRPHHIRPFAKYPDLRFDVNNGITLCKKCHDKVRGKEDESIDYFQQKLIQINKLDILSNKM